MGASDTNETGTALTASERGVWDLLLGAESPVVDLSLPSGEGPVEVSSTGREGEAREVARVAARDLALDAPVAGPTSILVREVGSTEAVTRVGEPTLEPTFALDLSASSEAMAAFHGMALIENPTEPGRRVLTVSAAESGEVLFDTEHLATLFTHYQNLYGLHDPESRFGAAPMEDHLDILRAYADAVRLNHAATPDVVTRLEGDRLLAQVYGEIFARSGRSADRSQLEALLSSWTAELQTFPLSDEVKLQDFIAIIGIAERFHLDNYIQATLCEVIQHQGADWIAPREEGEDLRAAIQRHSFGFELFSMATEYLDATFYVLRGTAEQQVVADAQALAAEAEGVAPALQIQTYGEVAALYRRLMVGNPVYRDNFTATLERVLTVAGAEVPEGEEGLSPGIRISAQLQVATEFESIGNTARATEIRTALASAAGRALRRGMRRRLNVLERMTSLQEAYLTYRELGQNDDAHAASEAIRGILNAVLEEAGDVADPELGRQYRAFALEGFLLIGDVDRAGELVDAIRSTLIVGAIHELPLREAATDPVMTQAQGLLRLMGYAQQIATTRADASGGPADFSQFRALLGSLQSLGEANDQPTMVLYARFMTALVDNDPVAESLYHELEDYRSAEFIEEERAFNELNAGVPEIFLSGTPPVYTPDPFQNMAAQLWETQELAFVAARTAPTLRYLNILIEGNYGQRIAEANDEEETELAEALRGTRDLMRVSLSHIQSLIASGRASTTREAIELLPEVTGSAGARDYFIQNLGRTFDYYTIHGERLGQAELVTRLFDFEAMDDPEMRARAMLSLARELTVEDSLNQRAGGLIEALLSDAEAYASSENIRPSIEDTLRSMFTETPTLDHWSDLYNRVLGNDTLGDQIEAARDVSPYVVGFSQIVDQVFSVEGGAIMLASIFTAGIAAELAGAAMLARMGATAFTVVNGVSRLTWGARIVIGATRIGAGFLARSAVELGGTAAWRLAIGRRQMTYEELRVRVIVSFFSSIGDEFATRLTQLVFPRLFSRVLGMGERSTHLATEVVEFFADGLGEMGGEYYGNIAAGHREFNNQPFLVAYFQECLHGAMFMGGHRVGHPLAESIIHSAHAARVTPSINAVIAQLLPPNLTEAGRRAFTEQFRERFLTLAIEHNLTEHQVEEYFSEASMHRLREIAAHMGYEEGSAEHALMVDRLLERRARGETLERLSDSRNLRRLIGRVARSSGFSDESLGRSYFEEIFIEYLSERGLTVRDLRLMLRRGEFRLAEAGIVYEETVGAIHESPPAGMVASSGAWAIRELPLPNWFRNTALAEGALTLAGCTGDGHILAAGITAALLVGASYLGARVYQAWQNWSQDVGRLATELSSREEEARDATLARLEALAQSRPELFNDPVLSRLRGAGVFLTPAENLRRVALLDQVARSRGLPDFSEFQRIRASGIRSQQDIEIALRYIAAVAPEFGGALLTALQNNPEISIRYTPDREGASASSEMESSFDRNHLVRGEILLGPGSRMEDLVHEAIHALRERDHPPALRDLFANHPYPMLPRLAPDHPDLSGRVEQLLYYEEARAYLGMILFIREAEARDLSLAMEAGVESLERAHRRGGIPELIEQVPISHPQYVEGARFFYQKVRRYLLRRSSDRGERAALPTPSNAGDGAASSGRQDTTSQNLVAEEVEATPTTSSETLHALIADLRRHHQQFSELDNDYSHGEPYLNLLQRAADLLRPRVGRDPLTLAEIDALEAAFAHNRAGREEAYGHEPVRNPGVYQAISREQVQALSAMIRNLGARRVVEVGAGDGRLAAALRGALQQDGVAVRATDDHSWDLSSDAPVERQDALEAARDAEVILLSWPPKHRNHATREAFDLEIARLVAAHPEKTFILLMAEDDTGSRGFFTQVLGEPHPLDLAILRDPDLEISPTVGVRVFEPMSLNYVRDADGTLYTLGRCRRKMGGQIDGSYTLVLRSSRAEALPSTEPILVMGEALAPCHRVEAPQAHHVVSELNETTDLASVRPAEMAARTPEGDENPSSALAAVGLGLSTLFAESVAQAQEHGLADVANGLRGGWGAALCWAIGFSYLFGIPFLRRKLRQYRLSRLPRPALAARPAASSLPKVLSERVRHLNQFLADRHGNPPERLAALHNLISILPPIPDGDPHLELAMQTLGAVVLDPSSEVGLFKLYRPLPEEERKRLQGSLPRRLAGGLLRFVTLGIVDIRPDRDHLAWRLAHPVVVLASFGFIGLQKDGLIRRTVERMRFGSITQDLRHDAWVAFRDANARCNSPSAHRLTLNVLNSVYAQAIDNPVRMLEVWEMFSRLRESLGANDPEVVAFEARLRELTFYDNIERNTASRDYVELDPATLEQLRRIHESFSDPDLTFATGQSLSDQHRALRDRWLIDAGHPQAQSELRALLELANDTGRSLLTRALALRAYLEMVGEDSSSRGVQVREPRVNPPASGPSPLGGSGAAVGMVVGVATLLGAETAQAQPVSAAIFLSPMGDFLAHAFEFGAIVAAVTGAAYLVQRYLRSPDSFLEDFRVLDFLADGWLEELERSHREAVEEFFRQHEGRQNSYRENIRWDEIRQEFEELLALRKRCLAPATVFSENGELEGLLAGYQFRVAQLNSPWLMPLLMLELDYWRTRLARSSRVYPTNQLKFDTIGRLYLRVLRCFPADSPAVQQGREFLAGIRENFTGGSLARAEVDAFFNVPQVSTPVAEAFAEPSESSDEVRDELSEIELEALAEEEAAEDDDNDRRGGGNTGGAAMTALLAGTGGIATLLAATHAQAQAPLQIFHAVQGVDWGSVAAILGAGALAMAFSGRRSRRTGTGPELVETHEDLLGLVDSYEARFLFLGHGSKGQFADLEGEVYPRLDKLVALNNARFGAGKWLAIFGGDNFNAEKPDIAHVMKYLRERHGVPLLAIQSDVVVQWGGVDAHVDYVHYVPTHRTTGPDGHEQIVWGGFIGADPVGPTATYLGDDFLERETRRLTGIVALGGGPIAKQEVEYSMILGVPVQYIRSTARHPEVNGPYGSLDAFFPHRPEHPFVSILARWIQAAWNYSGRDAAFVEGSAELTRRFVAGEISVDDLVIELRRHIHAASPESNSALLCELAMSLAEGGLIEPVLKLIEEENLPALTQQSIPDLPQYWHFREGEIRAALVQAMVEQGIFSGPLNPIDQIAQIREVETRFRAWEVLLRGIVGEQGLRQPHLQAIADDLIDLVIDAEEADLEKIRLRVLLHHIFTSDPPKRGGPGGGGGILASALLAMGTGLATLFGAAEAQAQDLVRHASSTDPMEVASWFLLGGTFLSFLYYIARHSEQGQDWVRRSRARALETSRSLDQRRENLEFLLHEAQVDPMSFDEATIRALRDLLRAGNLAALDVIIALCERDHPEMRRRLTAEDVRHCEDLLVSNAVDDAGMRRLVRAGIEGRLSVRLMDVLADRLNDPIVFQALLDGILRGNYRSIRIFIKALEAAAPEQRPALRDMLRELRRRSSNFHVQKLRQLIMEQGLTLGISNSSPPADFGRPGGPLAALLATTAGVSTLLATDVAHASVGLGHEAMHGLGAWVSLGIMTAVAVAGVITGRSRNGSNGGRQLELGMGESRGNREQQEYFRDLLEDGMPSDHRSVLGYLTGRKFYSLHELGQRVASTPLKGKLLSTLIYLKQIGLVEEMVTRPGHFEYRLTPLGERLNHLYGGFDLYLLFNIEARHILEFYESGAYSLEKTAVEYFSQRYDSGTVLENLQFLLGRGLVERRYHPNRFQTFEYRLTAAGRELLEKNRRRRQAVETILAELRGA